MPSSPEEQASLMFVQLTVKAGAVPWLVRNLGSSDRRLQRSAVRTLFTVGGQAENLKAVSEQGTLQVLEVSRSKGLVPDLLLRSVIYPLHNAQNLSSLHAILRHKHSVSNDTYCGIGKPTVR
jgi:hypothetical protein